MATPKAGYFLKDGTKVPSVTTIIGRFKESGGLMYWAWKLGTEGKDYREEQRFAAHIGTMVHEKVEAYVNKKDWVFSTETTDEVLQKVDRGFNAYREWQDNSKIEIIETEMPLVSELHRYGGTPDALGRVGDSTVLVDWKASNAVYSDYLIQLAAYENLLQEVRHIKIDGYHLCRFSKDYGDFSHHYFSELSEAWESFTLMRRLYDLSNELKKRVK